MEKNTIAKTECVRCQTIITGNTEQKPIDNAAVIHDGSVIHEVGPYAELKKHYSGKITDMGEVTIVPGLVNAHCHLKLSKLKGKTVAGKGFVPWLLSMIAQNYRETDFEAVIHEVLLAKDQGICCFGDTLTAQDTKIADILAELGVYYTCFCEAFGFFPTESQDTRIPFSNSKYGAIAGSGHALHTTNAQLLQEVKLQDNHRGLPFSIHIAEHEDEIGMLMGEKTGFYNLLQSNTMLDSSGYVAPMKTPVEYAQDLGLLGKSTLAVHCVHLTDSDIALLATTKTNVCLCPRSNDYIGVGRAPWEKLLTGNLSVSLGTDSLASNHDLNLWHELAYFIRSLNRDIALPEAISLVTLNPAKALLMDDRLGTLEQGKQWQYAVMPEDVASLFA